MFADPIPSDSPETTRLRHQLHHVGRQNAGTKLDIKKTITQDFNHIISCFVFQSSKRTLRSNEIMLPAGGGLLDTALELRFALQYPHYLKQWEAGNRLQVMLQRRKRYKNRTILGYKTLCSNTINMVAAVQRQMDMELELYGEATSTSGKESVAPLARLQVQSLTSQPVDHEEAAERLKTLSLGDGAGIMNHSHPLGLFF
jgi:phosphofurin acidic cluster sorting protein 2